MKVVMYADNNCGRKGRKEKFHLMWFPIFMPLTMQSLYPSFDQKMQTTSSLSLIQMHPNVQSSLQLLLLTEHSILGICTQLSSSVITSTLYNHWEILI